MYVCMMHSNILCACMYVCMYVRTCCGGHLVHFLQLSSSLSDTAEVIRQFRDSVHLAGPHRYLKNQHNLYYAYVVCCICI